MSIFSLSIWHQHGCFHRQTQFSASMDFEGIKSVHKVLNIGRHYTISSAIRKTEKGKQFVHTFGDFVLCKGVNIYSVNLDRETTFLTLPPRRSKEGSNYAFLPPPQT